MEEKRALTRRQFASSDFDASGYSFNEQPGEFVATIDCKRWGKTKLISYFTFEDGRKVVSVTWPRSNYRGLTDMPLGSKVKLTFRPSRTGTLNLMDVVLLSGPVAEREVA